MNEEPQEQGQPGQILRYVLVSRIHGIYLGSALGMGFWTGLDAAGQTEAVTFESPEAGRAHMARWEDPPDPEEATVYSFVPVRVPAHQQDPQTRVAWVTQEQCREAGLPGWDPSGDPPPNFFPPTYGGVLRG